MDSKDVSFLDRIAKGRDTPRRERVAEKPERSVMEPRDGHTRERQETGFALELELRRADEQREQTIPWSLYAGCQLLRPTGGAWEELTILFSNRVVQIVGRNLHLLRRDIREGKLTGVQEHDSAELALLTKEDESAEGGKKSIIFRIKAEPPFEALADAVRGEAAQSQ